MIRCPECESDITEIDVFCPFCGISLQQAPPAPPLQETDESMESTIMMPLHEVRGLKPDSADDKMPSIEDIPTPAILGDIGKTQDNVTPLPTGQYGLDEIGTAEEAETVVESLDVTPLPSESIDVAPANAVVEPDAFVGVEKGNDDAEEEIRSDDGQIEPADPSAEPVGIEASITEEPVPPAAAEQNISETSEARVDNREPGISKPLDELPESASFASNPMFDSVRIMENKPQDEADTHIQHGFQHKEMVQPAPPGAAVADPAVSDHPEERASTHSVSETEPAGGTTGDTGGKLSSKLKPLTEGAILNNRYEIVRKIGGGGMGAVYLASDNNLGGVLRAVKEMVQAHIEEAQQEKAINDFKRESMILSMLDHPSIPTIYDYFYDEAENRFYLVMKYISGGDLASRIRAAAEGKIDEKSITDWAIQITDVLDYLHNQPSTIVYRDLKPSNIMIDGNSGRIMLIDFGIARSISHKEEKGVTAVGTMGYAPPELFSGNVEPRSDIYSLGSTMFHLLTGADPQSNPLLIFDFQKNPRPRQINPQLSDQMERILMRAVEYNADARFVSAAEMKRVLEEHAANLASGRITFGITEAPSSVSLANQSVFCGFCGQRIVATDLFCAFCGAKQPIAQQGVHSEIYSQPAVTAKLVIEGTSDLATPAFSLQKSENLLGRRDPMSNIFPEVDLSKYDPQTKISRRHARIWRDGTNFLVEDLGSSNGTVLAPAVKEAIRLVPHQPHALSSGDKIKVGDTTLQFVVG